MSLAHTTVVFLQNPWFPPGTPENELTTYMTDVEFRRQKLASTMTGSRLLSLFGPMFYTIWWDNAHPTPLIGNHRAVGDPDPEHMLRVLLEQRPQTVGLLGKKAVAGMQALSQEVPLFFDRGHFLGAKIVTGRHPNAMGCTAEELEQFSETLINRSIGVVGV